MIRSLNPYRFCTQVTLQKAVDLKNSTEISIKQESITADAAILRESVKK
jgi:hypothetical protein